MFAEYNIIITVGPSMLNKERLRKFSKALPCIFRINGAMGSKDNITNIIHAIRGITPEARILLDMPGNKIRTCDLFQPITVNKGCEFCLLNNQINLQEFCQKISIGDIITASDGKLRFQVIDTSDKMVRFRSLSNGTLENNRGLHLKGISDDLPFLFDKDREIIEVALENKVSFLGLSFVRRSEDVKAVKKLIGSAEVELISKIELMSAIRNLDDILQEVDHVIIDRGDLIGEVGIIELPYYQEYIIRKAVHNKVNVYLATQFLKSMENSPVPLISEVMDLHTTLSKMISGIQLSEETAVGRYPDQCLEVLTQILDFVSKNNWQYSIKTE